MLSTNRHSLGMRVFMGMINYSATCVTEGAILGLVESLAIGVRLLRYVFVIDSKEGIYVGCLLTDSYRVYSD